jgi:hypothetical protein
VTAGPLTSRHERRPSLRPLGLLLGLLAAVWLAALALIVAQLAQ